MEDMNEESMIMYMPVEVETVGGMPSEIIKGLKMEPPPRPRAPEIHPPRKAKTRREVSCLPPPPVHRISQSRILCPQRSLSAYSRLLMVRPA
jgi:hypothetical protein